MSSISNLIMLAVACCGWDDPEGLERLLKSCWNKIDLFFYIDGAFEGYKPYKSEQTRWKQTQHILKDYPNVMRQCGPPLIDLPEYKKRQIYLDICEEWCIEWLIIADTDEYFHPDSKWDEFKKERNRVCNDKDHLYNLKNYTEINLGETKTLVGLDQPRLIRHPTMIHYLNKHHYQFAINGTEDAITAKDTLYSIKLCHDPHLRSQARKDKHDEYIKWLKRYELKKMHRESPKEKANREVSVWAGN